MQVAEATRKARRKQTAEVFTPAELVNEMLEHLPAEMWEPQRTFCDPAAGNGNFLVEILRRKLALGHDPLQALSTVYGVELMEDNVVEMRARLKALVDKPEADDILQKNIVCHDALTYNWLFGEKRKFEFGIR